MCNNQRIRRTKTAQIGPVSRLFAPHLFGASVIGAAFIGISMLPAPARAQDPAQATAYDGLPDLARALIDSAADTGEQAQIDAVAKAVAAVFPDYSNQVDAYRDALAATLPTEPAADETPEVAEAIDPAAGDPAATEYTGWRALAPWDGKVNASAVSASGNSDNLAIGLAFEAKRHAGAFTHNVNGYFDIGESGDVTNQRRWGAAYKLDYALSERAYAFGRIAYDEDEFSGFDYRLFGGAGAGYFIAKSEPLTWKVEAGPGYRYSPIDDTQEVDEEFALYGASETDWLIREGLLFEQNFAATYTDPTTTFESTTSLTTKIWEGLTTGVSYYYRFETNPPLGREQTDTVIRANVGYAF